MHGQGKNENGENGRGNNLKREVKSIDIALRNHAHRITDSTGRAFDTIMFDVLNKVFDALEFALYSWRHRKDRK